MDLNITLPSGAKNHGNPSLICLPPNWYDYIIFYFTNYIAHAFTVLATPGQAPWEAFFVALAALLFPGSGISKATRAILRRANLRQHPLRRAALAGALCMLVKTREGGNGQEAGRATPGGCGTPEVVIEADGESDGAGQPPAAGDDSEGVSLLLLDRRPLQEPEISESENSAVKVASTENTQPLQGRWWKYDANAMPVPPGARIHGERRIPPGYQLVLVPPHVPLEFADEHDEGDDARRVVQRELACAYNVPKLLVSLAQAVWAIITVYRARGDQIEQYGYAAFGLTVVPYAIMSIINIIAGLLTPEYPAVLMVRTPVMDEAERSAGAFFTGEIRIKSPEADDSLTYRDHILPTGDGREETVLTVGGLAVGLIQLAIVGGLSRFQTGDSTSVERGFTMSWLVVGIVLGPAFMEITEHVGKTMVLFGGRSTKTLVLSFVVCYLLTGLCAIGGMVVVGLEIRDYGVCTRID